MGNAFKIGGNINNNNGNDERNDTEVQNEEDEVEITLPMSTGGNLIQIISSDEEDNVGGDYMKVKHREYYHSFHPVKEHNVRTYQLPEPCCKNNNKTLSSSSSSYSHYNTVNEIPFESFYDNEILSFFELNNNYNNLFLTKKSKPSIQNNIPINNDTNLNNNKSSISSSNKKKASYPLLPVDESNLTITPTPAPSSPLKQFHPKNAMKKTTYLQSPDKTHIFPHKTIQILSFNESSTYKLLTSNNKSFTDKPLLFSLLSSIPFLKSLPSEHLNDLIESMQYIQIEPHTLIMKQHSKGSIIFFIKKGKVKLCPLHNPHKILTIKTGPFVIGERLLLNDTTRQWDVWTLTPIYAYIITYNYSYNFIKRNIIICDKHNNRMILDKCATLRLLTDDQKDKLSLHMKKEIYNEKETIINIYDKPYTIFILVSGDVVNINGSYKTLIHPGNMFGYNNLIYPKQTYLNIKCNKQCICLSFGYDDIKEVIDDEENCFLYFRNLFIKELLYRDSLFRDVSPLIDNFILNNFIIKFYASDEIVLHKGKDINEMICIIMEGDVYIENEPHIKLKDKHGTAVLYSEYVFSNEKYILEYNIRAYCDCFIAKVRKKTVMFHIGKSFSQAKKILSIKHNILNTKCFNNESLLGVNVLDMLCTYIEEEVILNEGTVIYNERTYADKIYFVIEGEVKIINNDNECNINEEYIYKRKFSVFGINTLTELLYKNKLISEIPKIKYNEHAITSKRNTKLYKISRTNFLSCFNEKETLLYYILRRIYFMETSFPISKMYYFPLYSISTYTFLSKRNPFDSYILHFRAYPIHIYSNTYLNNFSKLSKLIRKLDNPFLLNIISITITSNFIFYLSPFISGSSLHNYIFNSSNNHFHLNYDLVKLFAVQLFIAVRTLHRSNLVHRYINDKNVMIDEYGYVTLMHVHTVGVVPIVRKETGIEYKKEDLGFLAPEMLYGNNEYGYGVDYWAIGVLMYLMVCGKMPFGLGEEENEEEGDIVGAVLNEELVFPVNVIDEDYKDFVMRVLDKVEDRRMKSWDDVIGHPFYKGFKYKDVEMRDMNVMKEVKCVKNEVNVYKNEKYITYEEMQRFLYKDSK